MYSGRKVWIHGRRDLTRDWKKRCSGGEVVQMVIEFAFCGVVGLEHQEKSLRLSDAN